MISQIVQNWFFIHIQIKILVRDMALKRTLIKMFCFNTIISFYMTQSN